MTSDDINAYIKEVTEDGFSAKDFRTWNATVLAAVALAVSGAAHGSKTGRTRAITRAVKEVAHYLGNTPAVCRASYIDPRVFDRFRDGLTIGGALEELGEVTFGEPATQGAIEEACSTCSSATWLRPPSSAWPDSCGFDAMGAASTRFGAHRTAGCRLIFRGGGTRADAAGRAARPGELGERRSHASAGLDQVAHLRQGDREGLEARQLAHADVVTTWSDAIDPGAAAACHASTRASAGRPAGRPAAPRA